MDSKGGIFTMSLTEMVTEDSTGVVIFRMFDTANMLSNATSAGLGRFTNILQSAFSTSNQVYQITGIATNSINFFGNYRFINPMSR